MTLGGRARVATKGNNLINDSFLPKRKWVGKESYYQLVICITKVIVVRWQVVLQKVQKYKTKCKNIVKIKYSKSAFFCHEM